MSKLRGKDISVKRVKHVRMKNMLKMGDVNGDVHYVDA